MVKRASTRKNKSRKPRRRSANARRLSNFPPAIPFHLCFMNVVLRHVLEYSTQPINSRLDSAITIADMFDGPWTELRGVFSEVKVLKVHIYAMSGSSFDERGYHAINLAPMNEFEISEKTTFPMLMSLPGTKADRITRLVSAVWYPTAPNERMWMKTDSNAKLMDWTYMSHAQASGGTAAASYPLEITIDAHVKVRGVSYQRLKARASDGELDAEFVNLATY